MNPPLVIATQKAHAKPHRSSGNVDVATSWAFYHFHRAPDRWAIPDIARIRALRADPRFCVAVSVGTLLLVNIFASDGLYELLQGAPHYVMKFLLLYTRTVGAAVRDFGRHLAPPMQGEGRLAEDVYRSTKRSFIWIGGVLTFCLVIVAIAKMWGVLCVNLAVGYLVLEVVSLWINAKLASEQTARASI